MFAFIQITANINWYDAHYTLWFGILSGYALIKAPEFILIIYTQITNAYQKMKNDNTENTTANIALSPYSGTSHTVINSAVGGKRVIDNALNSNADNEPDIESIDMRSEIVSCI